MDAPARLTVDYTPGDPSGASHDETMRRRYGTDGQHDVSIESGRRYVFLMGQSQSKGLRVHRNISDRERAVLVADKAANVVAPPAVTFHAYTVNGPAAIVDDAQAHQPLRLEMDHQFICDRRALYLANLSPVAGGFDYDYACTRRPTVDREPPGCVRCGGPLPIDTPQDDLRAGHRVVLGTGQHATGNDGLTEQLFCQERWRAVRVEGNLLYDRCVSGLGYGDEHTSTHRLRCADHKVAKCTCRRGCEERMVSTFPVFAFHGDCRARHAGTGGISNLALQHHVGCSGLLGVNRR